VKKSNGREGAGEGGKYNRNVMRLIRYNSHAK